MVSMVRMVSALTLIIACNVARVTSNILTIVTILTTGRCRNPDVTFSPTHRRDTSARRNRGIRAPALPPIHSGKHV